MRLWQNGRTGFFRFCEHGGLFAAVSIRFAYQAASFTLTIDGVEASARALMCSVANTSSYGGGMLVAPDARIVTDVRYLFVAGGRTSGVSARFSAGLRGRHTTHPKVSMYRCRQVEIVTDPPLPLLIDGRGSGHYSGSLRK